MKKIFIDGSAGTTGLRIRERLAERRDLSVTTLPEETRKDPSARAAAIAEADVAFLCLPDSAAIEAANLAEGLDTVIIDTSTAHRVAPGWTYGLAELPGRRELLASSRRIANPGCHATGFIAPVAPLVRAGIVPPDARLTCFSLTGYTGGGKKMIAEYERAGRDALLDAPRLYGLALTHKHLPEMAAQTGLDIPPVFCPVVADFPCGMLVVTALELQQLRTSRTDVAAALAEVYPAGGVVHFDGEASEAGFMSAAAFAGRDDLQICIHGSDERLLLVSRFDNLGKGASGAAIQNMNIALGLPEKTGLTIPGENG